MTVQPAVRQETKRIALGVGCLTLLMIAVFLVIGQFDYTVLLGGLLGAATAIGNFFLMALTVQKAADEMKPLPVDEASVDDEDEAEEKPLSEEAKLGKKRVQTSYTLRMFGMGLIAIAAVLLPCFHPVASLLPLLFPRIVISLIGALSKKQ
ncbi:MAG: hypothetical protein IJ240_06380 [Clostridia bacterium]|nr:hypothetical protein [Clostridia bacterium]